MSHSYLPGVAALALLTAPVVLDSGSPAAAQAARAVAEPAANVRASPFRARGDGATDDTAAIQAALDASETVYLPAGVYLIDARRGLRVRTGSHLFGSGRTSTILKAAAGGGSPAELAAHQAGSIIRRAFDPAAANGYVTDVRLHDFTVLLTHPNDRIATDAVQIGIDFRSVTRSSIERVHVGNTPPPGSPVARAPAHVFDSQGYGIVLGTVPSSLPAYAGGEVNLVRDVNVWGAYKGIVLDDDLLSPRSATHATVVERADIQGAQHLLSQESEYARAIVWRDNVLQNVVPQPGGNDRASVLRIEGRDVRVDGGYVEAGGLARYLVTLGPATRDVAVALLHTSCTGTVLVVDQGLRNRLALGADCDVVQAAR